MSTHFDPSKIGKPPQRARAHKRSATGAYLNAKIVLDDRRDGLVNLSYIYSRRAYATGYLPEKDEKTGKEIWPRGDESTWKKGLAEAPPADDDSISKSIIRHVQTVRSNHCKPSR